MSPVKQIFYWVLDMQILKSESGGGFENQTGSTPKKGGCITLPPMGYRKRVKKMGTRAQVGGTPFALFTAEAK